VNSKRRFRIALSELRRYSTAAVFQVERLLKNGLTGPFSKGPGQQSFWAMIT